MISTTEPLSNENDALDLIALGWEHDTYALMIHYTALSEDFLKLKITNYGVKVSAIIPNETIKKGRLKRWSPR